VCVCVCVCVRERERERECKYKGSAGEVGGYHYVCDGLLVPIQGHMKHMLLKRQYAFQYEHINFY
jgi:hypothetical protein